MPRVDSQGMFWFDEPAEKTRGSYTRSMPPIPDTGWKAPKFLPDLSEAKVISIDCETKDPYLLTKGPGWARGEGHIVGVSIGTDDGYRAYFPIRHEVEPEDNWPPEVILGWLKTALANPKQPKVGANLLYDLGWLKQEGVEVSGELVDVQFAEALLDETAATALEAMGQKYLGEGKESNLLYQWLSDFYGGAANGKQRANIYRSPPRLAGPYAESDADLPLRLAKKLYPLLLAEGLYDLFILECGLIRLLLEMRFAGVTVDIPAAEQLREALAEREALEVEKLKYLVGFKIDINAAASLAKAFDKFNLPYNKTEKGSPSFTKGFLQGVDHPIGAHINEIRKLAKLRGTFVESYILNSHINGKVYGQFHPLRGDAGGTVSGRYSSSTPNLQNLPSRDDELAPMVRGIFIPDGGHVQWRKYDYSQIEYRFLAHYATGDGAETVRDLFNSDPNTDYHEVVRNLIHEKTGQLLGRKPTKTINFGLIYGMGIDKLSKDLKLSFREGKKLSKAYHTGAPFVQHTMDACSTEAENSGVITTILGRKSRFNLWEPTNYQKGVPLPYEQASMYYREIQRAYTYRALNRRLQGSAADLLKVACLECWNDGVFAATGVPRLTVHDELDFSDPGGKDEAFREMKHIMETAIKLRVPVKSECDIGPNWGNLTAT